VPKLTCGDYTIALTTQVLGVLVIITAAMYERDDVVDDGRHSYSVEALACPSFYTEAAPA
jgi:hypothetical protein